MTSNISLGIDISINQIVDTLSFNVKYKKITKTETETTIEELDIYNHTDRNFIKEKVDTIKLFYTDVDLKNNNRADLLFNEIQNELVIPKENVVIGDKYYGQIFGYKNNIPIVISNKTNAVEVKSVIDPSYSLIGMDEMIQLRFEKEHIDDVIDISDNKDIYMFIFTVNERLQQIIKNNINISEDLSFNNTDNYYYYNIVKNETINNNYTIINGDIYEVTLGYTYYLGDSNILSKNVVPSLILEKPINFDINSTNIDTELFLTWNKPLNAGEDIRDVYQYWIYRSTLSEENNEENNEVVVVESELVKIKELSGNITEYYDKNLSYGTLYNYYIRAVRRRIASFDPGEVENSNETILNDDIIEGILSDPVEGYVFNHNEVSNQKPIIEYFPSVNERLMFITINQSSNVTIQNYTNINGYSIDYDISYSYKDIDNNVISSIKTYSTNKLDNKVENILELFKFNNDLSNKVDLSMNFGQILQTQYRLRQIYKTNQYNSLWSDTLSSTPYSLPKNTTNIYYEPDILNDKQFYLSWNPVIYDPSFDSPYINLIKYKVYVEDENGLYNEIETIDTEETRILIRETDISMNYNHIYNFKVQTYLPSQTNDNIGGITKSPTDALSDINDITSIYLDVFIFQHKNILEPNVLHKLEIDNNLTELHITTPFEYLYNNINYESYYDISTSFMIQNDNRDISSEIVTDNSNTIILINNITFGDTFYYQIRIIQIYRGYEFLSSYYNINNLTTFTTPKPPSGLHIRPVTDDNLLPLSSSLNNGKLRLSWDHIDYDKINGVNGKYSSLIKYRIWDYKESGANGEYKLFEDNNSNTYTDITDNYVILENLTIGLQYRLNNIRVQAYYDNNELSLGTNVGIIYGNRISIISLLEKDIISTSKNIIYGNNGIIYNNSSINNNDVNLNLFSSNSERETFILSDKTHLKNIKLKDLSSISFSIDNITPVNENENESYLYIGVKTQNNSNINNENILYFRSLHNDIPYGKINFTNYNVVLAGNWETLNNVNSGSIIIDTPNENDIITSIFLKSNNINSFTLKEVSLYLNNHLEINNEKTVNFQDNSLRILSSNVYNDILNIPFYYPSKVDNLYVDKTNVVLNINQHNIPLYWSSLSRTLTNIEENGGLPDNVNYIIYLKTININGTYEKSIVINNIDTSFNNIQNNPYNYLYKIEIKSVINYNNINMSYDNNNSISPSIFYMLPSSISNIISSESDKTLTLSWDEHSEKNKSINTNLTFKTYEYTLDNYNNIYSITNENTILNDLLNGVTYNIGLRVVYNFNNGEYNEDYYSLSEFREIYKPNETSGTTPFFKPIISNIQLIGDQLTLQLNNNGRPIREFILVYVPKDDNIAGNINIDTSSYISTDNQDSSISRLIAHDNNKDSNREIIINTPYRCKYVFIIFENLAGTSIFLKAQQQ